MEPTPRVDRVALFAGGFLVLVTGVFWGLPSGKNVAGALVILDGGAPYRDFWTMYAPGQFYAVAALYGLFGRELLVQSVAAVLVTSAAAAAFMVLLRRIGASRTLAWSLAGVFVLMSWTTAPALTDYPLALPFLLLALDRCVRYCAGAGHVHLRWAGLWLGVGAWFKHDVAGYAALGMAIGLHVSWALVRDRRPAGWVTPIGATVSMAAFAVAAAAPVAAWTAWSGGQAAWQDLVIFPATVFGNVRGDPFPALIPDPAPVVMWLSDVTHVRNGLRASDSLAPWVMLYVPVALFCGGIGVLGLARRRIGAPAVAALAVFLACMPFFWAAAHVQQNTHPYTLGMLGAAVATILSSSFARAARARLLTLPALAGAAVYAAALVTTPVISAAAAVYEWPGSRVLDLPGLRGVRVPARLYHSFQPIGEFFRAHTAGDEPIYTGLGRHDAIVINNALLYAIAGRPACCGFTELHPGVADRAPVQEAIVRRLESSGVRAIALWDFGWTDDVMEARRHHIMKSIPDAGATVLDTYIADHFDEVARHGEYRLLWRRDTRRPGW